MLSFACEFPVKASTSEAFIRAVVGWIENSPHATLGHVDIAAMPAAGYWIHQGSNSQLEALISQDIEKETVGLRYIIDDQDIRWRTTIVFSRDDSDDAWVGIRTDRETDQVRVSLPKAKKPLIVKALLADLHGGLDGELRCQDKPHLLRENDLGMTTRLINGDADNYLPIVYLSCDFNNRLTVDAFSLAKALGGMAHVLVEPDRNFSRQLQAGVSSRNPYGGSLAVFWPSGESSKYIIHDDTDEREVRQIVAERIRQALLNRRPLARCTWSRAEAEVAQAAFERLKSSGSEDVTEYIALFDSELSAKNAQLAEAESEVSRLRRRIKELDVGKDNRAELFSVNTEQQFYENEFNNIFYDAIKLAVDNAMQQSRRYHVLSAALLGLTRNDTAKMKRVALKDALDDYKSMSREVKDALTKLGFTMTEEGKHIKLTYMQDSRYVFVLPKTGSDHRGGKNAVSDIAKRIF